MKHCVPKFGYMVVGAKDAKDMKHFLYNMVRFERGRAVIKHGRRFVSPTIFLNRKAAELSIRREKICLSKETLKWRSDIEYMRKRGLFRKYHGLLEVMNAQPDGCLCGTRRPMFKIRRVNIEKWKELLNGYDFVVKGDRLVERWKGEKES